MNSILVYDKLLFNSYERSVVDFNNKKIALLEAKVKISEIKYLSSSKIFLLSLLRIDKENENNKNLISSVIKFEFIDSSKSKNINQNNPNILLELLAIDIFKKNHNFEITLLFSKNRFITLSTEIVDVTLEDQNLKDDKIN